MKIEVYEGRVWCNGEHFEHSNMDEIVQYLRRKGVQVYRHGKHYVALFHTWIDAIMVYRELKERFEVDELYEKYRKMKYNELVHLAHERGLNPYRKKKEELIRMLVESER